MGKMNQASLDAEDRETLPICSVCDKPVHEDDADETMPDKHVACIPEYWAIRADNYADDAHDRARDAQAET